MRDATAFFYQPDNRLFVKFFLYITRIIRSVIAIKFYSTAPTRCVSDFFQVGAGLKVYPCTWARLLNDRETFRVAAAFLLKYIGSRPNNKGVAGAHHFMVLGGVVELREHIAHCL